MSEDAATALGIGLAPFLVPFIVLFIALFDFIRQKIKDSFERCRRTDFEKYKTKLSKNAKKKLDYYQIRILECDIYDGMVFTKEDGTCEIESYDPYPLHSYDLKVNELKWQKEKRDMQKTIIRAL